MASFLSRFSDGEMRTPGGRPNGDLRALRVSSSRVPPKGGLERADRVGRCRIHTDRLRMGAIGRIRLMRQHIAALLNALRNDLLGIVVGRRPLRVPELLGSGQG